ncbi:MAG: hypothetical protein M5U12_30220 [Verrucomicrobia bacterium]|nr:hypothetical protein [Verrucomicrobiota bacterium]
MAQLGLTEVAAARLSGDVLLNAYGRGGRVFVIEVEPLLDAALPARDQLRLTLYGFPNTTYRLESTPRLGGNAVWTELQPLVLPGRFGILDLPLDTEATRYFRLR